MVGRPPRHTRFNPTKPQLAELERVNEEINHPNRVVFSDVIVEPFGKQNTLGTIFTLNESFHIASRLNTLVSIPESPFSHTLGQKETTTNLQRSPILPIQC